MSLGGNVQFVGGCLRGTLWDTRLVTHLNDQNIRNVKTQKVAKNEAKLHRNFFARVAYLFIRSTVS